MLHNRRDAGSTRARNLSMLLKYAPDMRTRYLFPSGSRHGPTLRKALRK